jgi:membrane-associated phospholipid phosphatase
MAAVGMSRGVSRWHLWPVDKIALAYMVFTAAMEAIWFRQIPQAPLFLTLHVLGAALILLSSLSENPTGLVRFFRYSYPMLFVGCCYREMSFIILAIRQTHFDDALANLDLRFWGAYPTVWMERLYSPVFTEFLQVIYTLFIPMVFLVPVVAWYRKQFAECRYMAFLITLGFLASYVGYLIVPARGPRFLLEHMQHLPLTGMWGFDSMQTTLNHLEKDHYDCFPSGHTELTVLACWLSRLVSSRLFKFYFLYTLCIVFATVYLRYHYTADLLAGVAVASVLILAAPRLYRGLSEKGASIGD